MKKTSLLFLIFLYVNIAVSQTVIQMKKVGGVSIIPCKVNGLSLSFIFDTGASDVTISLTEATFMFKNGYLNKDDVIGTSKYSDANGDISEGININLREIEIQGLKLYNVKAAILKNMDAPLLLGQSAISKLGSIQINLSANTLTIINGNESNSFPDRKQQSQQKTTQFQTAVKIGSQTWSTKNLDVSYYRNGDPIPQVTDPAVWTNLTTGAWCYYENNNENGIVYGKLYNWYAVNDPRGLAPDGYHIPTDFEWTTLTNYLGANSVSKLKSTSGWNNDCIATNISGFSALPGGCRYNNGKFNDIGTDVSWWSTTEQMNLNAFSRTLYCNLGDLWRFDINKTNGLSIRLVKD
jgi:clan AA aspartic protease (TIGR02281 family)